MSPTENSQEVGNNALAIKQLIADKKSEELAELLEEMHPAELVSSISDLEDELQTEAIKHITGLDKFSAFVSYATPQLLEHTFDLIDDTRLAAVIRRQEVDDASQILEKLPHRRQVKVLKKLSAKTVKEITSLLAYDQHTAGRIMTTLFVSASQNQTAKEVLQELRANLSNKEIDPDTDITYIFILDKAESLVGICSLRHLLSSDESLPVSELMTSPVVSVSPEDDQEFVARVIADYDFSAIPVVSDEDKKIIGIITVDDVLDVIEETYTEDILKLAGTEDEDTVHATTSVAIKSRLPWLLASWLGGIMGAMLLGSFSHTLEKVVALAFFMPVVFGMGGNVGSQASTIAVRGIATGHLRSLKLFQQLRKELAIGLTLGGTFGILLFIAAYILYRNLELSAIVGLSILITMTCAASLGSLLPILFDRIGVDPAVASGPFVSTSTDILSITIYFSVASFFLF
jgi:magnesium transporter